MKTKSKAINLIKFISAIIIACIYHYKNDFPVGTLFERNILIRGISNYGYLLVELFFIISGYLFYISYSKKIKNKKINFTTFIKKRYLRLIPLAALTSIIMFILESTHFKLYNNFWIFNNNDLVSLLFQMTGIQFWAHMYGSSLNNVTWYISSLLLCYIVYFFITRISKNKGNIIYIGFVILFIILMTYNINIPFINPYTLRGLIAFGIGIILSIMIEKNDLKKLSNASIVILVFTLIFTAIFRKNVMGHLVLYLDLIIYPCLLINIFRFEYLLDKIDYSTTEFLSNISFGIYLWNLPLQLFFHLLFSCLKVKVNYGSIYTFVLQIIIHIIFSIFSYKVIEKQLNKVKNIDFKIL